MRLRSQLDACVCGFMGTNAFAVSREHIRLVTKRRSCIMEFRGSMILVFFYSLSLGFNRTCEEIRE